MSNRRRNFPNFVTGIKRYIRNLQRTIQKPEELQEVVSAYTKQTGYYVPSLLLARAFLKTVTSSNNSFSAFARVGRSALKQRMFIDVSQYDIRVALIAKDLRQVPFTIHETVQIVRTYSNVKRIRNFVNSNPVSTKLDFTPYHPHTDVIIETPK